MEEKRKKQIIFLLALVFVVFLVVGFLGAKNNDEYTKLEIVFWPYGPDQKALQKTITCDKESEREDCLFLNTVSFSTFEAPSKDPSKCPPISGGPDQAVIEGVVRGKEIVAAFKRNTSCDEEKFQIMDPLFSKFKNEALQEINYNK